MRTVLYQNTRADFVALLDHQLQTRYGCAFWLLRRGFPVALALLSFVLVALIWRYEAVLPTRQTTVGLTCAILCLALSQCWPVYFALNFWFARRAGFGDSATIELRNDGVQIRHKNGESLLYWTTFSSINSHAGRFFLFLTARSALIVPGSAFSSLAEAEAFVQFARMHWESAKNNTVSPVALP